MVELRKFYKGKRVFVTGHTGFKGTWLVSSLLSFGAKITGYSLNDNRRKTYESMCDFKKVKNIYKDVLNLKDLKKTLKTIKPEIVFHLAAQPLVSESYKKPYLTVQTNLIGTLNLIESAKNIASLKSLVIVTSDKCYQNNEVERGYKETDRLGGEDPYSASKAAAEIICNSYLKSNLINIKKTGFATARAGNVIGGGDWSKDRVIPDCIKSIINKKKLIIRNPNATRPWQHVLEPISGYLLLSKKIFFKPNKFSSAWNFGPQNNQTLTVQKVVNIFFNELNIKKYINNKKGFFKESKLLKLNSNKSKNILKWKNTWSMKKSIEETAFWYNNFLKKKDLKKITSIQVNKYFNKYD